MLRFLRRNFARDRRASIALITAITCPLLFLAVGVPIDLARAIQYRAALQNVADGAALAGTEVLGLGATPAQACNLTLAYVNVPITNGELPSTATPSATLSSPSGTSYSCNGSSSLSTPQTTTSTAPNTVAVSISGSQPTTFLSIYEPAMAVSASSQAIGPQGFITICIKPAPNYSGDLSQAYYYLRNSNGTLVNEDGTTVNPSSSGTMPGDTGGVELSAFLGDDKWPAEYPPPATNGYCDAPTDSIVAVQVKLGLAQRLGIAYYVVYDGQAPCTAVFPKMTLTGNLTDFSCLTGDKNYGYYPYNYATNIQGFFTYYQDNVATNPSTHKKYNFLPNGYGTPLGGVSAFFSTDYPASLNTNNYKLSSGGGVLSPEGGDTCFTTYNPSTSSTVGSVVNGYSASSQTCLINESAFTTNKALTAENGGTTIRPYDYNGNKNSVVFWSSVSDPNQLGSIGGTSNTGTDLVCLVSNGASVAPASLTNDGNYSVATVGANANVQQENLVVANSSVAANVYRCPVDTVGSPFYPDPTCAELNGATLQMAWNDMGGSLNDNGNYVDLHYSYSCQPAAAQSIIDTAVIQ